MRKLIFILLPVSIILLFALAGMTALFLLKQDNYTANLNAIYNKYPDLKKNQQLTTIIHQEGLAKGGKNKEYYGFVKNVCSGLNCYNAVCIEFTDGKISEQRESISKSSPDQGYSIDLTDCRIIMNAPLSGE